MEPLNSAETMEWAKNFLSGAAQSQLTQWLIIVGVIWQVIERKVSKHFVDMAAAVRSVTVELSALRAELTNDLKVQRQRLDALDTGVRELKGRVIKLEDKEH